MSKTKLKIFVYIALLYLIVVPRPVHAYIDPGTGSYLFQLLVAGLLGSMFFMKSTVAKLRDHFKKSPLKKEPQNEEKE